ncbi:TenA family transcriptional regulator [Pseudohongiella sp.]|uniref:Thiaminase-2/PQQC domain-containing protein n=1 Tax=marine sediment metagenome TaxID=412755 RepID=A0A0F9W3D7_9ZZZZ|nr:iron-containing redox enzyme family protein [Pseudohongiella sp.]HDZ08339.1 biliverdin-producing heme oxygenase [Pseudohongiella sp.]HEA61940.1 biliverdin-producing heme oxygenase [Pseudohongiella sp.]
MKFYDELRQATVTEKKYLFSSPLIQGALQGKVDVSSYSAFLAQAFHHVSHTVPLLMACGARLPARMEWLRGAMAEYIEEEYGHQEWILNDIKACGGDAEAVRHGRPALATELMVSTMYDRINRLNPVSMLGMIFVLEGTSIELATNAANTLQASLKLPEAAFSYLSSHGALDQEHMKFYEKLVNRLDDDDDKACVIDTARVIYTLYAQMFRTLPASGEQYALAG